MIRSLRCCVAVCGIGAAAVLHAALLQGCSATQAGAAQADRKPDEALLNPDPSVRLLVGPSEKLVENLESRAKDGSVRIFGVQGSTSQVILSFEARTAAPQHRDLNAYSAWADAMLKEREIRALDIGPGRNPIKEAGFAFVASTYVNVHRPGQPAPTAICDAAGLRFETPGGFWTISWNSDLGKIGESLPVLHEFLGALEVDLRGR